MKFSGFDRQILHVFHRQFQHVKGRQCNVSFFLFVQQQRLVMLSECTIVCFPLRGSTGLENVWQKSQLTLPFKRFNDEVSRDLFMWVGTCVREGIKFSVFISGHSHEV